jgi:hypothetical protein
VYQNSGKERYGFFENALNIQLSSPSQTKSEKRLIPVQQLPVSLL